MKDDIAARSIPLAFRPWLPFRQTQRQVDGKPTPCRENETFWVNSHYVVHRYEYAADNGDVGMVWLSLRTVENTARHDWREFQRVKNELTGPEWWAIEGYPAESALVDTSNQYHLWCFPEKPRVFLPGLGISTDWGYAAREVMTPEEVKAESPQAEQRPFRDDIAWPVAQ